jgi:hypothetical protein
LITMVLQLAARLDAEMAQSVGFRVSAGPLQQLGHVAHEPEVACLTAVA